MRTPNVKEALNIPIAPIYYAKTSNFYCNGVESDYSFNFYWLIPTLVFFPTTRTRILATPSITRLPEIKKGSICYFSSN